MIRNNQMLSTLWTLVMTNLAEIQKNVVSETPEMKSSHSSILKSLTESSAHLDPIRYLPIVLSFNNSISRPSPCPVSSGYPKKIV